MRNVINNITNNNNDIIILKDKKWLLKQRVAGKVVAQALSLLENQVKNKTKYSLLELNNLAEEFIISHGCELTFKGYKGFPTGVCISVNKQLVHGIPTNYYLQEGDVVSFDLGATFEGTIADSAITCIYGEPKSERIVDLVKATKIALAKGIESIAVGKKLGCIGNAIYKHIKNSGFSTIDKYGGHGICISKEGHGIPHASPFVSNKSNIDEGIRIQPGLTIAIEPMAIIGDTYTYVDKDGWTVWGQNISAHQEHSIFVHEDNSVEILTEREEK